MAVYTQLDKEKIENFLAAYDVGVLESFDGILQGVENTNYKIQTSKDKYILTVFEKRTDPAALPYFFSFTSHLKSSGIECPATIPDKGGNFTNYISGKTAALIGFLNGRSMGADDITLATACQAGELLARMHLAAENFGATRENSMSLPAWEVLYEAVKDKADTVEAGLSALMRAELDRAGETLKLDLPKASCHLDFFADNVFIKDGNVSGVIDFYFTATDFLIYDFAIAVNAWCFKAAKFNRDLFNSFLEGYQSIRAFQPEEKKAFQDMARMAALRILMTRSNDWVFHDPANLVKPKDPLEYKQILEFHRHEQILG